MLVYRLFYKQLAEFLEHASSLNVDPFSLVGAPMAGCGIVFFLRVRPVQACLDCAQDWQMPIHGLCMLSTLALTWWFSCRVAWSGSFGSLSSN